MTGGTLRARRLEPARIMEVRVKQSEQSRERDQGVSPNEKDPREYPFGYFARDAYVLSGIGLFRWFASENEALRGYLDDFVELAEQAGNESYEPLEQLREFVTEALSRGDRFNELVPRLNAITSDDSVIVWCGTFLELTTSDADLPRELREYFLDPEADQIGDGDAVPPIPEERIEEFIEYVQGYGY